MLVNKDFLTWHLIGSPAIQSAARIEKSLLTDMNFHTDILIIKALEIVHIKWTWFVSCRHDFATEYRVLRNNLSCVLTAPPPSLIHDRGIQEPILRKRRNATQAAANYVFRSSSDSKALIKALEIVHIKWTWFVSCRHDFATEYRVLRNNLSCVLTPPPPPPPPPLIDSWPRDPGTHLTKEAQCHPSRRQLRF